MHLDKGLVERDGAHRVGIIEKVINDDKLGCPHIVRGLACRLNDAAPFWRCEGDGNDMEAGPL